MEYGKIILLGKSEGKRPYGDLDERTISKWTLQK
jgi:hypothetical protein